ncbi:mannose-1-phosphate guanylyltransferase [Microbacterium gorillae]|uniref:mannose-1-phosphate guanylyltransferase n=1 Tax=Microbacterium gorillae TaxID=1231063 RepID=UPI00058D22EC|nr:mannose-1-phosphate guanylyltransferase [Microbacterium gorillae]
MNAEIDDFYAVIPAGGIGSRLWPLSRADAPKFLHDLTGSGHSLLRDTWDRLLPLTGPDRIAVVTGRAHRAAVEGELPDLTDQNIFLESEPRDSSAAIGLAAAILHRRNPNVVIGSFAADHVIIGPRVFQMAVEQAVATARAGYIVTIGIQPTEPAVGFGYIKRSTDELVVDGAPEATLVEHFVEKPDLETAKAYLAERTYLWNAGMFISRADVLLDQLARTKPELHAGLLELAEVWDDRDRRGPAVDRIWPKLEKIAIDYSVAEPAAEAGRLAVIPGHFDWDDVGDFASLAKLMSRGRPDDFAILGSGARVLTDASSGILVSQTKRVISVVGVRDIVIVDTPDALLVTTKEQAQRVKGVVDALKLTGRGDVL